MSNTPQAGISRIKKDENGFWKILHSSDIVYSITQRINNEDMWIAKRLKENEEKEVKEEYVQAV